MVRHGTATGAPDGGLEGTVVAETRLSRVDGEGGQLWVRGHHVEELARSRSFEAMCSLLWSGQLPGARAEAMAVRELGAARVRAFEGLPRIETALAMPDSMAALRAALASLMPPSEIREARRLELAAAVAVYAAAWSRRQRGLEAVPPDPRRGHAEDLLRMIRGEAPAPAARALDAYLVTVAEHGMNASTFTARVVASTGSDAVSAVVAAIGALKGPRHGGAPGPVLDMLDAIGRPEAADAWLRAELAAGRRLMGLGHRIYRVRDPRAAVLEQAVAAIEASGGRSRYLEVARAVERAAVSVLAERYPDRKLDTNVEFYTAVLLDAIGLPRAVFTPAFAAARVAGWLAHVAEQRTSGRIIRPSQHYIGSAPAPRCASLDAVR